MPTYATYYMQPSWFSEGICGIRPTLSNLKNTHTFLRKITARNLDDVFHQSQGEIWSPNGEARSMIEQAGLGHTSMSVGDIIQDTDSGKWFAVSMVGFSELTA